MRVRHLVEVRGLGDDGGGRVLAGRRPPDFAPGRYYRSSILGVKLSVSLSADDVALLDSYARDHGLPSRSAALQRAVRQLSHADLERDYVAAFTEWDRSGEREAWDTVAGDGQGRAAR